MSEEQNVPESVRVMSEQMDGHIAAQIYVDLRWKLKVADRSIADIEELVTAAIKRCEKKMSDSPVRAQAIEHLQKMLQTFKEIAARPAEFDIKQSFRVPPCPACGGDRLVCTCEIKDKFPE